MRGLGDLVAFVLSPLESLLRRLGIQVGSGANTPVKRSCGCQRRKDKLNKLFPFGENK